MIEDAFKLTIDVIFKIPKNKETKISTPKKLELKNVSKSNLDDKKPIYPIKNYSDFENMWEYLFNL